MKDIIYAEENKIIIQKRMNGRGSVKGLAGTQYDIKINMGKRYNYVIIAPACYNLRPIRCLTKHAAKKKIKALYTQDYIGVKALDRNGNDVTAYIRMED
jgi:hypothetical protein